MAKHTIVSGEPVVVAYGITLVVGLVAGAVGVSLNDGTVDLIAAVVWIVVSATATVLAHARVTPLVGGWKTEVRDIVEQVVQDVVSTQLNLGVDLAPSGQPAYVPAAPPPPANPPPVQMPMPPMTSSAHSAEERSAPTRPTSMPRPPLTARTDATSQAERVADARARSPLRQDSGTTWPQPRP